MIEIVNVSQNWAIGKQGELFITIPEDMRFFREQTKNQVCIMGSTTLYSFPNHAPLKNRVNIVLADDPNKITRDSVDAAKRDREKGLSTELICVSSPEEAISEAAKYTEKKVFVIGGATVYKLMLPYCDTCLVTHNDKPSDGADVFYPDLIATGEWQLESQSEPHSFGDITFRFCTYRRTAR